MVKLIQKSYSQYIGLFLLCFAVYAATTAPTIYALDSSEFAIGAYDLSIVHAPGYPLYLLLAHLATWLIPIGDIAFRVNLLSALCLALAIPALYFAIARLIKHNLIAVAASLSFAFSFQIWASGIRAEIYALQILSLSYLLWWFVVIYQAESISYRQTIIGGMLIGLAVSVQPASLLLAVGIAIYLLWRLSWQQIALIVIVSLFVFVLPLLYFPIRFSAMPAFNIAGQYLADGTFDSVDLTTFSGIWWMLTGSQFDSLFFVDGLVPSIEQLITTGTSIAQNYVGIGVIIAVLGVIPMWRQNRMFVGIWIVTLLPYLYFFTTYGAADKETMYAPIYLLLAVSLGFGLAWVLSEATDSDSNNLVDYLIIFSLPVFLFVYNFPALNLSNDTNVRDRAEITLEEIPEDAIVLGEWFEVIPLQYLQIVEDERADVRYYNLFLFDVASVNTFLSTLADGEEPVIVLGEQIPPYLNIINAAETRPIVASVPTLTSSGNLVSQTIAYELFVSQSAP